jgi:hypothetical protein
MDGMVAILQKALQVYARTVISHVRVQLQANMGAALIGEDQTAADALAEAERWGRISAGLVASKLFKRMLRMDADSWNAEIRRGLGGEDGLQIPM